MVTPTRRPAAQAHHYYTHHGILHTHHAAAKVFSLFLAFLHMRLLAYNMYISSRCCFLPMQARPLVPKNVLPATEDTLVRTVGDASLQHTLSHVLGGETPRNMHLRWHLGHTPFVPHPSHLKAGGMRWLALH